MPVREDVLEGGDRDEGDLRGPFGLIGGVVAGLMLSEIIGIVGYLMLDSAVGIKFLPIYLAILFAVVAPPWMGGSVTGQNSHRTAETKGADHEETTGHIRVRPGA